MPLFRLRILSFAWTPTLASRRHRFSGLKPMPPGAQRSTTKASRRRWSNITFFLATGAPRCPVTSNWARNDTYMFTTRVLASGLPPSFGGSNRHERASFSVRQELSRDALYVLLNTFHPKNSSCRRSSFFHSPTAAQLRRILFKSSRFHGVFIDAIPGSV